MTVRCPRCGTQYRVPESRLSEPRPVFKCTRCNHMFSRGAERPAARPQTRSAQESRNLSFSFDPPSPPRAIGEAAADEGGTRTQAGGDDPAADGRDPAFAGSDDATVAEPRRDPAFVSDLEHERDGRDQLPGARPAPPRWKPPKAHARREEDVEETLAGDERDEAESPLIFREPARTRQPPIDPRRQARRPSAHRSPLKPVGLSVAALVFAFALLAVILDQRPEVALEKLASVPLLGRLIGDDHLLVWRLQIGDVEGGIDRIKGDRPAFVVSGQVLNTTSQNLRLIEVEGRLLADGVERRRQVVYAANQFRKTIRDLSASEVEMLLRLEPNRRFLVRPGESASFLLVFPDPPPNATEVTCRVVDARVS